MLKVIRKIISGLVILILPLSLAQADSYTIDPSHTYPAFKINHLGFSTMQGKFNKTTGSLEYTPGSGIGSVKVVIDASSIDTGHGKRDEHLMSPDFLNTAEFPEITFESTGVKFSGQSLKEVSGNLTIMGVSRPVILLVTAVNCGVHPFSKKQVCGFDAFTSIKRTNFGVSYGAPNIGDKLDIIFELEAVKN